MNDIINAKREVRSGAPQQPSGGGQAKLATQQHISDYAKAKGITPQQAVQEFKASGYTIQ